MAVTITGVNECFADLEVSMVEEVNTMLYNIEADAEANTPVRTGHLKASYGVTTVNKLTDTGEVYNDAPYAIYVELGSAHNEPVGMLTKAVDKEMNNK